MWAYLYIFMVVFLAYFCDALKSNKSHYLRNKDLEADIGHEADIGREADTDRASPSALRSSAVVNISCAKRIVLMCWPIWCLIEDRYV